MPTPISARNVAAILQVLRAIAGAEPELTGEDRRRLTLRRAEMGGQGRFLLARVGGKPASVVAFYEGEDRYVHHLATRVPFRRRGIASRLLEEVLADARERGCRSTIISAAESGHRWNYTAPWASPTRPTGEGNTSTSRARGG